MAKALKIILIILFISILLLLVGFALRVKFFKNTNDSMSLRLARTNDMYRRVTIENLQISLQAYYEHNSSKYPSSLADLEAAGEITRIPIDPVTRQSYSYTLGNTDQSYKICVDFETESPTCFTPDSVF